MLHAMVKKKKKNQMKLVNVQRGLKTKNTVSMVTISITKGGEKDRNCIMPAI